MVLPVGLVKDHLPRVLPRAAPSSVEAIAAAAHDQAFAAGETVALDGGGQTWTSLLVLDGKAAVAQSHEDGRQAIVLVAVPGHMIVVPAVPVGPVPLDIIGLTDGTLAAWYGPSLLDLAAHDAGLAADLVDQLLASVTALLRRVEVMTFDSTLMRLAQTVLEHGDLLLDPDQPILSRPQLATVLGTSREMTTRVLTQLEDAGAIERVGRSGIVLVDPVRVRDVAGRVTTGDG